MPLFISGRSESAKPLRYASTVARIIVAIAAEPQRNADREPGELADGAAREAVDRGRGREPRQRRAGPRGVRDARADPGIATGAACAALAARVRCGRLPAGFGRGRAAWCSWLSFRARLTARSSRMGQSGRASPWQCRARFSQRAAHRLELRDARVEVLQVGGDQALHVGARAAAIAPQPQQLADLRHREPEVARAAHEAQLVHRRIVVHAVARGRAPGLRDQARRPRSGGSSWPKPRRRAAALLMFMAVSVNLPMMGKSSITSQRGIRLL